MAISEVWIVFVGDDFSVLMTEDAYIDYEQLPVKERAKLKKEMEYFASHKEPLRDEGRHGTSSIGELHILALGPEGTQTRFYGAFTHQYAPRSFACVKYVRKKWTKAKAQDLEATADLIEEIILKRPPLKDIEKRASEEQEGGQNEQE